MRSFIYIPEETTSSVVFTSDNFEGSTLDPRWTFLDPLGDSSFAIGSSQAQITVPQPPNHDIVAGEDGVPKIVQDMTNADFVLTAKWDNLISGSFPSQGILLIEDATSRVDFKIFRAGGGITLMALGVVNDVEVFDIRVVDTAFTAPYLKRISRTGDAWTFEWSLDNGATWTTAASTNHTMITNQVGLYAGSFDNTGGHTALIDYISSADNPI